MTLVQARDLAAKRHNTALFKALSFTLQGGEYLEITGPNGSGKTTLLRVLAGLFDQFDGEYTCERVMYSGHRLGLDPLLNGLENLTWLSQLEDRNPNTDELLAALERVGMAERALQPVAQLSQGQQRRIRMAHWLLSSASVWLLDEPLNALDSGGRGLVSALIDEHLTNSGAVVCATHLALQLTGPVQAVVLEAFDG